MTSLYLIFKNLMRHKVRLSLTLLAIFSAFLIYGLLSAFNAAMNAGVDLAADDRLVVVNKVNFTQPLPYAYFNRVKSVEGVVAVAHFNWFGGYYQEPRNVIPVFAASPQEMLDLYPEMGLADEARSAFIKNRQAMIAGRKTADEYGWSVGDRIPLNSNIFSQKTGGQTWEFDLVGIYEPLSAGVDEVSVFFHYEYFNESRSFGTDRIGFLGVRTEDPEINEAVIKAIDDQFANSFYETETVPEEIFNKAFIEQIGNIGLIITSIVGAAFFTSLFIVANTMILNVRERTAEIAIFKTIGFSTRWVFLSILGESLTLAVVGGGLGLITAFLVMSSINASQYLPIPSLVMTTEVWGSALVIIVLLGISTGIIPAVGAWRASIIDALSRR